MPLDPPALAACLAALFGAGLLLQARTRFSAEEQPVWFCALLGLLLAAAAAPFGASAGAAARPGEDAGLLLLQARDFLGLPLLGVVALALGRGWHWPRGAWGRVVLGLCVFFELARQLQWAEDYRLLLGAASLLLIAQAGLSRWPARRAVLLGLLAALSLGAPLLAATSPGLGAWLPVPGYLLLAVLLRELSDSAPTQKTSAPLS